jgi:lipopolysaccharide/colanic/teichoic acid biosynthesis glycosyltransferase
MRNEAIAMSGDAANLPRKSWTSPWCNSLGKRVFDRVGAVLLLIPSLPFMAVIAAAVKITSRGSVLFRQVRVGKDGASFKLLKFRTMDCSPPEAAVPLTQQGDNRITRLGRLLRQWKLDELPQLINVVRGEMSLVGPRPEVPRYCHSLYRTRVAALRPGVTGRASLEFRDEEHILGRVPSGQLEDYYLARILPAKAQLDLDYAQHASLFSDLKILLETARTVLR